MPPIRFPGLARPLLLVVLAVALGVVATAETRRIRLRAGAIETPDTTTTTTTTAGLQAERATPGALYLLQFSGPPQPAWQQELQSRGVSFLRYVADDAFVVRSDGGLAPSDLRAFSYVHWVGPYLPLYKLDPGLRPHLATPASGGGTGVAVSLLVAPNSTVADRMALSRLMGRPTRGHSSTLGQVWRGVVAATNLAKLTGSDAVLWVERAPKIKMLDEVATRIVAGEPEGDNIHLPLVHELGFDGRGVTVAVPDSGLDTGDTNSMHPDIAGRVDALLFYGNLTDASDEHSHGTHVIGIVAGNGATGENDEGGSGVPELEDPENPSGRLPALYGLGVAPKAHVVVQRIFDGVGNYEAPASNETLTHDALRAGAVIGSNSWGDDTQGRYDLNASEFDALVRDADAQLPGLQPFILEFSAGNAGPSEQSMDSPGVAKNVIATGAAQNNRPEFLMYGDGQEAMADFSSRGPCEDGRIKPDIVAPGTWIASLKSSYAGDENAWATISDNYIYQGGTSQAGPHAAGAAAVFVQYYRQTHQNQTPSPALVKAALINSATDMDDGYGTAPVPNNDEGWGRLDLVNLIATQRRYEFLDQTTLLSTGLTFEKRVVVGSDTEPLKITLVYTDVPGLPAAIPALVNDLDLEVVAPDGRIYRGNQFLEGESVPDAPAQDRVNNVEAVHLGSPAPGEYIVRVHAYSVAADALQRPTGVAQQDFALIASGDLPLPGTGTIFLDRGAYRAPDRAQIKLFDADLAGQAQAVVTLTSTGSPAGRALILKPAGGGGVFTGAVDTVLSGPIGPNQVLVAHGDSIAVHYQDASPASDRVAQASIDLVAPLIRDADATNQLGRVIVSWTTDEPAKGTVIYGTDGKFDNSSTVTRLVSGQRVVLKGLTIGANYKYFIVATDEAGNTRTNDNRGAYFTFTVSTPPDVLVVDAAIFGEFDAVAIPLSSYTDPLDRLGVRYEVWDLTQDGAQSPDTNDLSAFRVVIWRISDSLFGGTSLSATEEHTLKSYLNQGGSLFFASMEVLSRVADTATRSDVFHVARFDEDAGVEYVTGVTGDPVANGIEFGLDYSSYDSDILQLLGISPDVADTFTVATNATPIFLDQSSGKAAGLRYPRVGQDGMGRVVFLSFPLDAVPDDGTPTGSRLLLMRNALSFLAPGLSGFSSLALDNSAYTLPSLVTIELSEAAAAGQGKVIVTAHATSLPEAGFALELKESVQRGLFRGSIAVVPAKPTPPAGRLPANNGDRIWFDYAQPGSSGVLHAEAVVDTAPAAVGDISAEPAYEEATIYWTTSKPTDALVQFGESKFLGRTAYSAESSVDHEITLTGLAPGKLYYFQVVSRDTAGNTTTDDNQGRFHSVRTLQPLTPPVTESFDEDPMGWSVADGGSDIGGDVWQLGTPSNGQTEPGAHSPPNAWASNVNGDPSDSADTRLVSPAISLSGGNVATLTFWHQYDFTERSEFDAYEVGELYVTTNNAVSWDLLAQYADISLGWEQETIDLSAYIGRTIRLSWYYGLFSFEAVPRPGWVIDDVHVEMSVAQIGTVTVTNNIAQAHAVLTSPSGQSQDIKGFGLSLSNVASGTYTISYQAVPYFISPPSQTNTIGAGGKLVFNGTYTFPDSNHNGISDLWEQQFLGSVQAAHPGSTDTDQDGASDLAEFYAGTDPRNADSVLRLGLPESIPPFPIRFSWLAVPGHGYRVWWSGSLTNWSAVSGWQIPTSTTGTIQIPSISGQKQLYFKLEASP